MAAPKTYDAGQMIKLLRGHYLPKNKQSNGIFADEITSPDGMRRADLIWMPTTVSGGRGLHGHEVKVSRADLRTELNDLSKADPWIRYCDRWWLVVSDPKMLEGLDIPETWGIMAPPSGRLRVSMTIIRPAPKLLPLESRAGVYRLAAWLYWGNLQREWSDARKVESLERELERANLQWQTRQDQQAGGAYVPDERRRKIGEVLSALDRQGRALDYGKVDVDDIVAALIDTTQTRRVAQDARYAIRNAMTSVRSLTDPFHYVEPKLKQLMGEIPE